jgi:hypothetical protein
MLAANGLYSIRKKIKKVIFQVTPEETFPIAVDEAYLTYQITCELLVHHEKSVCKLLGK